MTTTMIFNEDGSYEVFEEQEVKPEKVDWDAVFEEIENTPDYDQYWLFDDYIEQFDEALTRKHRDQIDFDQFYTKREGKHVKPYFSSDFVRELIAANQFTNDLIGEIVSYESGLYEYVSWERQDKPNKKLIDEFKDEVKEYWEAIYGKDFVKMNRKRINVDEEIRMKQMKERLLEYI